MENETIPVIPVNSEVPVVTATDMPVVPETPLKKKRQSGKFIFIFVFVCIVTAFVIGYFVTERFTDTGVPPENVSQTPTQMPSVNISMHPLATSSAFMNLEKSVASLSAKISGFNPVDPEVAPPVLDLPLGFSN